MPNLEYNADRQYKGLLTKILANGKAKGDRTGTGTISIFSHTLEIDMSQGFPLLTTKKMFTKGIIHELLWFLNGDTNIQYLVQNGVNIWTPDAYREYKRKMEFVGDRVLNIDDFKDKIINDRRFATYANLGPVYGKQWVNWQSFDDGRISGAGLTVPKGINQIQNAIDLLNNNPDSRRIIVSAWNVGEIDQMALPPCHWAFELYTEELTEDERITLTLDRGVVPHSLIGNLKYTPKRRLHLKWHQRSVDLFLGLPFNIASYGLLLHMFAQQTNMVVGTLVGDLTNVHIYNNHIEQCKEQLSRESKELPQLELNKADDMFSYKFDDFKIVNYNHHPPIKGEISV